MKKIDLRNGRLKYSINVYDGDLTEMPERQRFEFETQMFASAHVPTDINSLMSFNSRFSKAIMNAKDDPQKVTNIGTNFVSGLLQRIDGFTCKNHAFYCLIEGVTNFSTEHAKKKMKILYEHGLNSYITDSICEDVKKKYIPNYAETIQAYTKAQNLIKESTH